MRRAAAGAVAALLTLAACGGDESEPGGSKPGGDAAAQEFIGCFKARSYEAARPPARQESFFAYEADRKGFPNTPVNVTFRKELSAAVFLIFFESEAKAKQALEETGARSVGDIPPQQRGPAVIGYASDDDKKATEGAINGCL